jgi:hypothetical protein
MRTVKRLILFLIIPLFFIADYAKASSAKPGGSMGEGLSELSREMKKIDLYLFHSEGCGICQSIIAGLTERLEEMYPSLKIILLDLKEPKNYEALCNFERRLGRRGEELPFAVIGNHLLTGEMEITERLDPIILEYLLKELTRPIPESKGYENPSQGEVSAELIYFHQSGCAKCGRTDVLLDYLKRKYPKLSIKKVDLSTPEGKRMGEAISERINLPDRERLTAPSILIGEKFLSAKEISEERIEEILLGLKRNPSPIVIQPEEMMKAENSIIERFKSLGPIPVTFGGLIDGINPCAFATLIFLVSYLTLTGRKREEVLKVGLVFTGSVFMTYLLIGLGIISFIQHFSFTPVLSKGIYLLASVFALAMGGLSFYDFLMWKRGKEKEMKLQLPRSLKSLIHKTVRGVDLSKYQLPGAVLLGFIVSLFEFTCTGQVYLPTIIFVMSISELWKNAFFYLLLYNFAFIIPLLSTFGLFYLGVTQRRFILFLQKRGALIKLLTSVFFFLLGAVMLATIF